MTVAFWFGLLDEGDVGVGVVDGVAVEIFSAGADDDADFVDACGGDFVDE